MDFAKCSPNTSFLPRRVLRELDLISFLTPTWKLSLCLFCGIWGACLVTVGDCGSLIFNFFSFPYLLYSTIRTRQVLPAQRRRRTSQLEGLSGVSLPPLLVPTAPFLCPCLLLPAPGRMPLSVSNRPGQPGLGAQSSQCQRRQVAVSRLGHWHLEFEVNLWV